MKKGKKGRGKHKKTEFLFGLKYNKGLRLNGVPLRATPYGILLTP